MRGVRQIVIVVVMQNVDEAVQQMRYIFAHGLRLVFGKLRAHKVPRGHDGNDVTQMHCVRDVCV